MDSLFKVGSLCVITLETGSANIFNSITEVIVKLLIADEVPDFYVSAGVVGGRLGHFCTRFETVLARQKFWRWSAMNRVMMSCLSASGSRSSSLRSLKFCSIVSSVTGIGGSPGYDLSVIFVSGENLCESGID